jgi:glycosyltransferase involved in cell wall biosynthesis
MRLSAARYFCKEAGMRVLNVNVILDPVFGGGTAERTYQMSKALAQAGVDCTILTTDVGLREDRIASLEGVRVVALPCLFRRFFVVRFSWVELKRLIAGVDVVHLMGHWSMLNVLVYLIARRTGTPYVICPAGELPLFGRSRWIKRIFNAMVGYRVVRQAAAHVAVTRDEIPAYEGYGIKAEAVTVIPNGVNEKDFQFDGAEPFARKLGFEDKPYILFMGRLNPIKGPDLLLEAFCQVAERFPAFHLVFAGPDGGLLERLQQTTRERQLESRVHFVGYVSGKDKAGAYRDASFLAIPSRQEAMSIVVLEAGICGTPVLITDRCGFDEIGTTGGGRVVQATAAGLADGLAEMMANPDVYAEMGRCLREFVRGSFTWELICQRYLALYRQVV